MQGNDKYERFLFRRPLVEFALSLFLCLLPRKFCISRRMNYAVYYAKILLYLYRMGKHFNSFSALS